MGAWMAHEVGLTGDPAWLILLRQINLSFQGFTQIPLDMYYQPLTPLLRPISAFIFLLGLSLLLVRIRDRRAALLVLWIVSFGIMGGFSVNAPAAQRMVAVSPAVAIVIGYGLEQLATLMNLQLVRPAHWVTIVMLLFTIAVGLDELRFYYFIYSNANVYGSPSDFVAQKLADYLKIQEGSREVYFFGGSMDYNSIPSIAYLAPQAKGFDMKNAWGSPDNPKVSCDKAIFVFLPEREADVHAVEASCPNGRLQEEFYKGGALYWLYDMGGSI
jgi:hypothetical protein